jgi:hypothetical protein
MGFTPVMVVMSAFDPRGTLATRPDALVYFVDRGHGKPALE